MKINQMSKKEGEKIAKLKCNFVMWWTIPKGGPWNLWSECIQFTKKNNIWNKKGINNWSTQLN